MKNIYHKTKRFVSRRKKHIVILMIPSFIFLSVVGGIIIQDDDEIGFVEIYNRGLNLWGDEVPDTPRIHPILKNWDEKYYELFYDDDRKILILVGNIGDMSEPTQIYFKQNPEPDEIIKVHKNKFLESVKNFAEDNKGTKYHRLDFSDNSIGFKNYILEKSRIKEDE